jgi:hypothetical protein
MYTTIINLSLAKFIQSNHLTLRDGDGNFSVWGMATHPRPRGAKIPRPCPREHSWGSFFSHLRPRQGIYSRGEPRGEYVPARSIIFKDKLKLIVPN